MFEDITFQRTVFHSISQFDFTTLRTMKYLKILVSLPAKYTQWWRTEESVLQVDAVHLYQNTEVETMQNKEIQQNTIDA